MTITETEIQKLHLTDDFRLEAPIGEIVDGRLCMRITDAQKNGLGYLSHWYSSYGAVAMVPLYEVKKRLQGVKNG